MTTFRKQREKEISDLEKDLENSQGLVVASYDKVKTPELNELRNKLRPLKSKCRIVKNTLTQIALKNKGINDFGQYFKNQSALVIQKGDTVASLKILVDFQKEHENLKIRAGYIDEKILNSADIKAMADLPPKPILLSQLLANFQGPVTRFAGVLSAPMRYLANVLDQVAKRKEEQKTN